MEKLYISNRNETIRMFDSDFFEFFSHVHPVTPLVLFLPPVAWALYRAVVFVQLSIWQVAAFFVLGLIFWTLLEYVIHRWVFHYEPKTGWGRKMHFIVHGVHHDYPNDASRLVMPPVISVPLALAFFLLFALILGRNGSIVWAGLIVGYLCYDMIHYATHHFAMKNRVTSWLKAYHLRHHFKDDHAGYGVSSPLWDFVFRTNRRPRPD